MVSQKLVMIKGQNDLGRWFRFLFIKGLVIERVGDVKDWDEGIELGNLGSFEVKFQ